MARRSSRRRSSGGGAHSQTAPRKIDARRVRLPMRFFLPAALLLAMTAMLLLRGYVHSEILADYRVRPEAATDKVPEEILDGGPVIDTRNGKATTLSVPRHKLVLTFDDGPDPTWTPKVLDVMKKHHAHGVFFITGTMASQYPDLVRRIVAEGTRSGCTPSTTPTSPTSPTAASTGSSPRTSSPWRAPPASAPRCSGRRTPPSPTPWTTSPGR